MNLGYPHAPEFPEGFTWLNTDRPLRFNGELRGQVVVLDFWTYCCINCLHVLPDLDYLEKKYAAEPVTIIGVHSNKYTEEAAPENIRQAILRYGITHPVIVDEQHAIWDQYVISAWPTLVVIDPTGRILGTLPGEGHREQLDGIIGQLLAQGRREGTLASGPLSIKHEPPQEPSTGLLFPGKVLADAAGGRLFIADSDHQRILITDWNGEVMDTIGSGQPGLHDGTFADASFRNPQGMALRGDLLYIADTDNHALRRANLENRRVETVAGNGKISYDRRGGHLGREQGLNSPWDVAFLDGLLFIAMAGLHQIWTYDPETTETQLAIGTGRENIADNPAQRAALAQTSGLSAANGILYFADSETSAIRQFDPATGQVRTLAGQGLFIFGDKDGEGSEALLQHPLGVAASPDALYVADTYNSKIRRVDLTSGLVTTVAGSGKPGTGADGSLELYEPGGLSVAGSNLFIADTNNHRIIHYHLDTGEWSVVLPRQQGHPLAEAA
ncbi:MAG: thioredoxin-like domain-containing protein [Armatimonadota bacterium]